MKEKIRLLIFGIIIAVICYFLFSTNVYKDFITKITPTNYVANEILYTDYVDENFKYNLTLYTNVEKNEYLNVDNNIIHLVSLYTPNLVKCNIVKNNTFSTKTLQESLKIQSERFAILSDNNGYILQVYTFPYDIESITNDLIKIAKG